MLRFPMHKLASEIVMVDNILPVTINQKLNDKTQKVREKNTTKIPNIATKL